jgi:hypothetical protein
VQICILPVHRSNRCADETLIGETSYLKMTAIVAAMMIAPATTATATELFILQNMRPGAPVFQPEGCHNQTDPLPGFPSGHLTSSNVATWVLSIQDSSVAPQTLQDVWPVCGTKNFASVRLYSAPQSHRTIVAILGICAYGTPKQAETHGSSVAPYTGAPWTFSGPPQSL